MKAGQQVTVKGGEFAGKVGVVREARKNHAGIDVAFVDLEDGMGHEFTAGELEAEKDATTKPAAKKKPNTTQGKAGMPAGARLNPAAPATKKGAAR